MRSPSDYPNQEPRTTLGDHDNPPLVPGTESPRFNAEWIGRQPRPEWERNMLQYGGLAGETSLTAAQEEAKHRRDTVIEMLIGGQANALYSVHTALALVQRSELTPEIRERLDQLFFYASLTIERVAKLMGKKPPSQLFSIKDLENQ